MSFDVFCDLKTIQKISLLNTKHLNVYQFDKPISDNLQSKCKYIFIHYLVADKFVTIK
jgi:hypothetical protein